MGTVKTIAKLVVAVAIGGTALYYSNPRWFQGFRPAVDTILYGKPNDSYFGNYQCKLDSISPPVAKLGKLSNLSICDGFLSPIMSTGGASFSVASEDPSSFNFTIGGADTFITGVGSFEAGGILKISDVLRSSGDGITDQTVTAKRHFSCTKIASCDGVTVTKTDDTQTKKPQDTGKMRAVFMRPCLSDSDPSKPGFKSGLYKSFPKKKGEKPVTMVAGGTLNGVCQDLKGSGVTDVFLPFKVDDEAHSNCGKEGELLYQSTLYPDRINETFKAAHAMGFDPIKAIMAACPKLRYHAWVPIFKDPKIIEDLAKQGIEARQYAKPFGVDFDWLHIVYSVNSANPAISQVTEYELSLLREIVANYRVSGINLDYIRYTDEDAPFSYSWIRQPIAISSFVRTVREEFSKRRIVLSADIWAKKYRDSLGQDLDDIGSGLDIIMPMLYTKFMVDSSEFRTNLSNLNSSYPKRVIPILRGWPVPSTQTPANLESDLNADIEYESLLIGMHTTGLGKIRKDLNF